MGPVEVTCPSCKAPPQSPCNIPTNVHIEDPEKWISHTTREIAAD